MKRLYLLFMLIFLMLIAVGCNGNADPSSSETDSDTTKVTFSYWGGDFDKKKDGSNKRGI